jgi:glycosyltransferase involved in cell wall biosynthesis
MQKVLKATLAKTDRILVLGESLRKMFAFSPELEERIHVVPNGIPIGRDAPAPKTLPSGGEAVRLLYLSNMILTKGYRVVLEAARILIREKGVSNLEVRFCGAFLTDHTEGGRLDADTARERFERYLREENLSGHVTHCGVVTGREKERELAEAHFLVLPTAYETEGQPICILEAMAAGCVVVATDYRAIPDMVVDGETGRLLSRADALEAAGAVKSVIDDPALFAAMSERAILRARSDFSVATYQKSLRRHILEEDTER